MQLADRVGVDHSALSKLERGIHGYTQPMLENIAEALRVQPAELLGRDPNDPENIWAIAEAVKQAGPDQRRHIMAIIATFSSTALHGK